MCFSVRRILNNLCLSKIFSPQKFVIYEMLTDHKISKSKGSCHWRRTITYNEPMCSVQVALLLYTCYYEIQLKNVAKNRSACVNTITSVFLSFIFLCEFRITKCHLNTDQWRNLKCQAVPKKCLYGVWSPPLYASHIKKQS